MKTLRMWHLYVLLGIMILISALLGISYLATRDQDWRLDSNMCASHKLECFTMARQNWWALMMSFVVITAFLACGIVVVLCMLCLCEFSKPNDDDYQKTPLDDETTIETNETMHKSSSNDDVFNESDETYLNKTI